MGNGLLVVVGDWFVRRGRSRRLFTCRGLLVHHVAKLAKIEFVVASLVELLESDVNLEKKEIE